MTAQTLLKNRQKNLKGLSTKRIAKLLGALSKRWLDKKYFYREKAIRLLQKGSGYPKAMAEEIVTGIFSALSCRNLERLLEFELGSSEALDGWFYDARTQCRHRATGPRLITHIFAGNVPQPAIHSLVFGLLLKSANILKVSAEDPGILDVYLDSLKAHNRALGSVCKIIVQKKADELRRFYAASDLVVCYGSDPTIESVRRDVPVMTRFVGYGHKVSFTVLLKESLKPFTDVRAAAIAKDLWMMNQRGCLSPRTIFVEGADQRSLRTILDKVGQELQCLDGESLRSKDFASAYERFQNDLGFRLQALTRKTSYRLEVANGRWKLLAFDSVKDFFIPEQSQTVCIYPYKDIKELLPIFHKRFFWMQAVALEGSALRRQEIANYFAEAGFNRITHAGRMQDPPLLWHHDGAWNLATWLRWTDLE